MVGHYLEPIGSWTGIAASSFQNTEDAPQVRVHQLSSKHEKDKSVYCVHLVRVTVLAALAALC